MTLKVCNMQGLTDALFREFISQPGERQWCSEILHAIIRGERMDTKELLRLPSNDGGLLRGSPRGSPRNSPVNSPRNNHTHLSPLLLPPSPRSPASPVQQTIPLVPGNSDAHPIRSNRNCSPVVPSTSNTPNTNVSITRSFCATLANEVRPATPSNHGIARKIMRLKILYGFLSTVVVIRLLRFYLDAVA
ncbi:hypothetical protein SK128_014733 [Halocaridina rubra]|uniref:Uncharacterized protein n=1 Tax=Halocaridina rubra TaxID=373956 RepID=A0AAN9AGB8_HALRR